MSLCKPHDYQKGGDQARIHLQSARQRRAALLMEEETLSAKVSCFDPWGEHRAQAPVLITRKLFLPMSLFQLERSKQASLPENKQ